jgi:hypothetical protein
LKVKAKYLVPAMLLAGTFLFPVYAGPASGGRPLGADLTGSAEVPNPGDPDGSGWANVTLNQGQGKVLFELLVYDIGLPVAAHIHVGAAGVPGGVVVPLIAPWTMIEEGVYLSVGEIAGVDPDLIKAIRQDPSVYYVNVHTPANPAGAIRGQLSK